MHPNTQISRGLERIVCQNEGARLEGLYGLAGFGAVDNFSDLETLSAEAGVPNYPRRIKAAKHRHECACKRMRDALPAAVAVKTALEEVNGDRALPLSMQVNTLSGIEGILDGLGATSAEKIAAKAQKAAASAQKKIAKIEAKEAKQEAKVAAKVAKLTAAGKTAKAQKVIAKDAKQDSKVGAKLVKLQNVISAANTAAQTATSVVAPSTPVTPVQAAAAALVSQAAIPATPAATQLATEVVANATNPGSVIPTASLSTPSTIMTPGISFPTGQEAATGAPASDGGFFSNVSPLALGGMALAAVVGIKLLAGSKKRG